MLFLCVSFSKLQTIFHIWLWMNSNIRRFGSLSTQPVYNGYTLKMKVNYKHFCVSFSCFLIEHHMDGAVIHY